METNSQGRPKRCHPSGESTGNENHMAWETRYANGIGSTTSIETSRQEDNALCPPYSSMTMDLVIAELDNVERICDVMIRRFQTSTEDVPGAGEVVDGSEARRPLQPFQNAEKVVDTRNEHSYDTLQAKGLQNVPGLGRVEGSGNKIPMKLLLSTQKMEIVDLTDDQEDDVQYEPYVSPYFNVDKNQETSSKNLVVDIWQEMSLARNPDLGSCLPAGSSVCKSDKVSSDSKFNKVSSNSKLKVSTDSKFKKVSLDTKFKKVRLDTKFKKVSLDAKFNEVSLNSKSDEVAEPALKKLVKNSHNTQTPDKAKAFPEAKTPQKKSIRDDVPNDDMPDVQGPKLEQSPIVSSLRGEVVEYQPYVWTNRPDFDQEECVENTELTEVWQELALHFVTSQNPSEIKPSEKSPAHCRQCDGIELILKDDTGLVCESCGNVQQDIENIFCPMVHTAVKKQVNSGFSREYLNETPSLGAVVSFSVNTNIHVSSLELHPFFEENLHAHQKEGFKFLTRNLAGEQGCSDSEGCILAHAPGTGKSFLMITFIQSFLAKFLEGRPVIIAPKIMLKPWAEEFQKWKVEEIPTFNLSECTPCGRNSADFGDFDNVVHGSAQVKSALRDSRLKLLQGWYSGRGVLLVSYNLFAGLVSAARAEEVSSTDHHICQTLLDGPNLLVLDEGHFPRTAKTKILKSLMQVKTKRKVLLSGTLFQNSFKELFNLLKLVRHGFIGANPEHAKRLEAHALNIQYGPPQNVAKKSKEALDEKIFMEEIGDPLEMFKNGDKTQTYEDMRGVIQKLQRLTTPFVHSYTGKILEDLPGLKEFVVSLYLTDAQQQAIADIPQDIGYLRRECKVLAACIHPSLVKMAEVKDECSVPIHDGNVVLSSQEKDHSNGAKMAFIYELLLYCSARKEKVLVFCQTLAPLKFLEDVLAEKMGLTKEEQLRLDGTMNSQDRQAVIDKVNKDPNVRVLLASTKACKEGISLVGASRVVIMDVPKNPSVVRQAVSRAFRLGQEKKVYVYRLIAHDVPVEQVIFDKSVGKEQLSKVLLDPGVNPDCMSNFTQEVQFKECDDYLFTWLIETKHLKIIHSIKRYNATSSF